MTCCVCLNQFELTTEVIILPCKHIFHEECIRDWLLERPICPMDRSNVLL